MATYKKNLSSAEWSKFQINLFRIGSIFLFLLTVPLDPAYYKKLFSFNWLHLHFQDVFQITNYVPHVIHVSDWGISSFLGWGLALLVGVIGAVIWGIIDKGKTKNYDGLYYWLRVLLRFRLGIGLIGYGIIKLFPVQIPHPTLSDLHTAYGDFLPWKIYYLSTGVSSALYEQTLGAIEIAAGLLLFFRRTAIVGAGIATAVLTNIVLANFAYQLGEHVYSFYLLLISVVIISYDVTRLYNLLVKERLAIADYYQPTFGSMRKIRYGIKLMVLLFILSYGALTYAAYHKSNWPFPDSKGLPNAYGVYNVREFKINDSLLPYSATDTTRWQDVVFEKWNVLSIKENKHLPIDLSSPHIDYQENIQRDYESKGNGGRAFYSYSFTDSSITLTNKNLASDIIQFRISRPNTATILLNGKDSNNDSLHIVLDKVNKNYLLDKGRRKPITIY